MKFYLLIFLLIGTNCFSKQDTYSFWQNKMKENLYLKELTKLHKEAAHRIETNYYGNDLKIAAKLQKECYLSEKQFANCLKARNFKKADEYAKSLFSTINCFSKFIKQNPDFMKLDIELRKKLLEKYFKSDSLPGFMI